LDPIVEFLKKNGNFHWRYITLGLGDVKMQELSILTNASTVDGYYFLGRTVPILSQSGIGPIDSAKFYGKDGLDVLEKILYNAQIYNLKWVFCNDPFYYSKLTETGFNFLFSQDNTGDGRFHGVTIWAKEGIPPIEINNETDEVMNQISIVDYVWGTVPISFLVLSLLIYISKEKFYKNKNINLKFKFKKNGDEEIYE
jgi:hypothetical protein